MSALTTTSSTVAVVVEDGSGIDLLHADVTVEDGHRTVEPTGQDRIDKSRRDPRQYGLVGFERLLNEAGWRVVSDWRPTAHHGGDREADVERIEA